MKHIAIDARIINSTTGTYVRELLNNLQIIDKINKYSILVLDKDKDFWKPNSVNFKIIVANFKNYSLDEQIGFKKLLDNLSPDLVHFCMPQQPVFYKGKTVTTFHDLTLLKTYNTDKKWLSYHFKQLVGRFIFKKVAKTSDQIIVPSKFTKKELLDFVKISSNKITITYESANIFIDKLVPFKQPFSQFILYVGQQSDYKNIKRLGDAHQKILEKFPNLGLILVGKLNTSILNNKKYFEDNNYKNILFTDFIPDSQRDWLYTKAEAYIFPSLMEGFGLPGLEAMGYGAPVISSNATCLPEVYGDAAIYFNPLDINDMATKIETVLSDDNLRTDLIKKGYQQIKKYSWIKTAQQTYDVYMKALNNK